MTDSLLSSKLDFLRGGIAICNGEDWPCRRFQVRGDQTLPDSSSVPQNSLHSPEPRGHPRCDSHISLRELGTTLLLRRRLVGSVIGGMLLACLLFCLICPNQYEAHATVAMRTTPASPLSLDAPEPFPATSFLAAPLQMETLATEFRSGQLAWRVIVGLKLYQHPGFRGRFAHRFAGFNPDSPTAEAREWLLKRFQLRLHVETLPHTMLVQIRFRCRLGCGGQQADRCLHAPGQ